MNQKNIFSLISVILILQGVGFYAMGNQIVASAFPSVDETGHHALKLLMEVVSALSVLVGLLTYATRTSANVTWAYTLGFLVLFAVTMKHYLVDKINVPIPAIVIQVLIVFLCGYLWSKEKKGVAAHAA